MKTFEKILCYSLSKTQSFVALFIVYVFSYYKLWSSYYLYNDDQGRKYAGYHGWLDWSRWTDTVLSNIIHTDVYLYDIAPLTQIIACVCLALASLIAAQVIYEKKELPVIGLIPSVILGVNPYFIGCFSYKYDSPYMALSVLSSIVPLYYWTFSKESNNTRKYFKYFFVSVFWLLVMITSYQSSAGIYPMLVVIVVLKCVFLHDDLRRIIVFVIVSIFSFVVSLIIFIKVLLLNRYDSYEWHAISPMDVFLNFVKHYGEVCKDYRAIWLLMIAFLLVSLSIIYLVKYHGNKLRASIYFVSGCFVLLLVAFGANIFIDSSTLDFFKGKYMYGVNVGIALLVVLLVWLVYNELGNGGKLRLIFKATVSFFVCYLVYSFIVFGFIYGNVLQEQWKYQEFRVHEVIEDMTELDVMMTEHEKTVYIKGNIGIAPVNRNLPDLKLFNKLLPYSFMNGLWGEYFFRYYYDVPHMLVGKGEIDNNKLSEFTLIHKSVYHEIFSKDDNIIIVLKNPKQNDWETAGD